MLAGRIRWVGEWVRDTEWGWVGRRGESGGGVSYPTCWQECLAGLQCPRPGAEEKAELEHHLGSLGAGMSVGGVVGITLRWCRERTEPGVGGGQAEAPTPSVCSAQCCQDRPSKTQVITSLAHQQRRTSVFPGGPLLKTPRFQCQGVGLIPGWGTRIPQSV